MSTSRGQRLRAGSHDETTHHPLGPTPGSVPATPGRRRSVRAMRLAVAAIALILGAAALQLTSTTTADGPSPIDCTRPAPTTDESDAACVGLWDRVRVLGLPEDEWASAAEAMGLFPRGEWISDDGLRWEHLDGTTHVVATPQTSDEPRTSDS